MNNNNNNNNCFDNWHAVPNSPSSTQSTSNSSNSPQFGTNANASQQPQFFLLTDGGHYGNGAIPMQQPQMNGIGIGNHQQNVQQQKQQGLVEPSGMENDIEIDGTYDESICEDLNLLHFSRKQQQPIKKMFNKIRVNANGGILGIGNNGGRITKCKKLIFRRLNVATTVKYALKQMEAQNEGGNDEEE